MSSTKLGILVCYAIMIAVAIVAAGSTAGTIAAGVLLLLVVAHLIEMVIFFKRCKQAGGSMAGHMLQVFLFGVFHIKELEAGA